MPGPMPLDAPVTSIQLLCEVACHAQPPTVSTETESVWSWREICASVGLIRNLQGGGLPACSRLTVTPATVAVPVRVLVPAFAVAVSSIVPSPVLPPGLTANHDTLLTAVHAQVAWVSTVVETDPPAAGTDSCRGETE